jgi:hypothetical protein
VAPPDVISTLFQRNETITQILCLIKSEFELK